MLLASVLAVLAAAWQLALADERIRGHARHLAEAVASEGYGLHHWLHGERTDGTLAAIPVEGTARRLTAAERADLAAHSATATWRRSVADTTRSVLPSGWEIVHLVATTGATPGGVVVLRPSAETVAAPTWDAVRDALDLTLGESEAGAAALAANALAGVTPAWNAARDRAIPAARLSRLDDDAVLRQPHAGHADLGMVTALLMNGNDIDGVRRLEGERGGIPEITGACTGPPPGPLCADDPVLRSTLDVVDASTLSAATAENVTVSGAVDAITRIRTGDAEIAASATTPVLNACADAEADLCGGGDLDVEGGTGTPDWTQASIFGDTVIRNGQQLTGVTRTIASTGIFGTLAGSLTVSGCLRVVNPFIHGGGC
ncbi:MAG: hypothetical protein F4213_18805 [Boseongicola sp. SB0677_bin_26]|nr:hypothetical protein [Boseongicola sp. SB0665_bin_10]MYG28041.1 hypothetical protein [Boseongicola sp. SB0677_bin_26]